MASTDASYHPIRGQAYRITAPIRLVTTLEVAGAGLSTLAGTVSKDGGAFASTTSTPVEIATNSGFFTLDLSATEMTANTVAVKVTAAVANSEDFTIVLYPLDLSEPTGRADAQSVKRFENYVVQALGWLTNAFTRNKNTGAQILYKADSSTTMISGTDSDDDSTHLVTRGKLS